MSTPTEKMDTQTDTPQTEPASKEKTPEELLAESIQRQKETQAAYTKSRQEIAALKAEKEKLMEAAQKALAPTLSEEQQAELEELKYSDVEKWRERMNELERNHTAQAAANLETLTSETRGAAEAQFELSRRQQVLKDFNDSAAVPITDELLANEVPPRITKKLENGEITFEDFLIEVSEYVGAAKVVANEATLNQPNLSTVPGGITPTDIKPEKSLASLYSNDIY